MYIEEQDLMDVEVSGKFISVEGEEYYEIRNNDRIRPFFMSLVSHSDHWMFISSTGGLTAGRRNAESSLFPYYTDDKIRDDFELTGSKTIIKVQTYDDLITWEPFSIRDDQNGKKERNVYKNRVGNKLILQEVNHELGLTFQYTWTFSERYGFVKKSRLVNNGHQSRQIEILDGIQNILPYGVLSSLQSNASNLVNAYKKNELDEDSGLGMFMLSAIIVDKAEPSEALKTTTAWSAGLEKKNILLSSLQLDDFRNGRPIINESDVRAERGAYFLNSEFLLDADEQKDWVLVAEVNQDHSNVFEIIEQLQDEDQLLQSLEDDIELCTDKLQQLVAKADGLQLTRDTLMVGRHYSNVLFNIMRGGIFDDGYLVDKKDFLDFVSSVNLKVKGNHQDFFNNLNEDLHYTDLLNKAKDSGDSDLIRLSYEYLPLTFSRRHGDPSRPWNKFSIEVKDEYGQKLRKYEGNWRDIFQNWEALAVSFPGYIISMISKFVNASTIDGYNPYRITREGIDWETIEPDNPWSYIGYWGDHQIIYLEKLLEIAFAHHEVQLIDLLSEEIFVYSNVPYRIKNYDAIVNDPQDTIEYDFDVEGETTKRSKTYGSDGKLVFKDGRLLKANLMEKLLVPFLTKISNFIPEGGIWLNTQRPEWNDANNALVGNGVSMVTLYYMRRFAAFMQTMLQKADKEFAINTEVASFFHQLQEVFSANLVVLNDAFSDQERKRIVDSLGRIGETYRKSAYQGFKGARENVSSRSLLQFLDVVIEYIDHSIKANRRNDGLYHAYNLLSFKNDGTTVDHLYEMLEGQVAVLSSGLLDLKETLSLLDALKASDIYREDQYSYMLYPNRTLPRFLEKNSIPADFASKSKLASKLLKDGNSELLHKDVRNGFHFNGNFNNVESLKECLNSLKDEGYEDLVNEEYDQYLDVFEQMFNHKAFTGRSGTFYGYEGLGSIYWHMVSKLLVAVQENIYSAWEEYKGTAEMGRMIDHYYEIRAGIGINKDPGLYGAIPTDPYSHTPGGRGVQQPGMTGQVKEDILNRWAELGVYVKNGKINFSPAFLSDEEYLTSPRQFGYSDINIGWQSLDLEVGQLAFTYCQVPIVYEKGEETEIEVHYSSGELELIKGKSLNNNLSSEIFNRTGNIKKIKVTH